jgi:hypothetical protein
MNDFATTEKTRLRRAHERGHFDRETVYAILDAGMICHLGYVVDGTPYVTPTIYWREDDRVYWHGSTASRMLRQQETGSPVCLTVSHLDGLVMARSGMHHSANYRSVMLLGKPEPITDEAEGKRQLELFIEQRFPGRWDELREMTAQEFKATRILVMKIDEVSAKVRTGGPIDDDEDYALPIWAGVLPLRTVVDPPIPDPRNLDGVVEPANIAAFQLG